MTRRGGDGPASTLGQVRRADGTVPSVPTVLTRAVRMRVREYSAAGLTPPPGAARRRSASRRATRPRAPASAPRAPARPRPLSTSAPGGARGRARALARDHYARAPKCSRASRITQERVARRVGRGRSGRGHSPASGGLAGSATAAARSIGGAAYAAREGASLGTSADAAGQRRRSAGRGVLFVPRAASSARPRAAPICRSERRSLPRNGVAAAHEAARLRAARRPFWLLGDVAVTHGRGRYRQ